MTTKCDSREDGGCSRDAIEFFAPDLVIKYMHNYSKNVYLCIARCASHSAGRPEPFWKSISENEYLVAKVMES